MAENLNLAFQLLFIGMISVFLILAIVVYLGRFLIYIVNKYTKKPSDLNQRSYAQAITNRKLAVLSSVVDHVTNNKGVIKKITKV